MINLKTFPIFIFILFFSCQPPLPENIDAIFADWFINSTAQAKKQLSGLDLSAEKLDSLGSVIRTGTIKTGKRYCVLHDDDGTEHILGFSTPSHIIKDSLYPLLIYLHGGIGTLKKDKGRYAYDMFSFLSDTMDIFLASPSGNKNAVWWSPKGLKRILKTIRYMALNFPVDPDRIILAGVSDGAAGCYAAANAICSPFAGFIAISGFGGILPQLGIIPSPTNLMQRPIYNINGGKDNHYTKELVQQFLDWLKENGVIVKSKFYPEEGHGFDYKLKEKATFVELIGKWRKPASTNICWTIVPDIPNLADHLLSWSISDSASDLRIVGYWKKDTLTVSTTGIRSFSIITEKKKTDKLFYKIINGKAKPVKLLKQSTEQQLEIMRYLCYPASAHKNVLHISL